jgi:hypothetical protein
MTKHDGRRAARPLAAGVMGPTTTTTHRIRAATTPVPVGPKVVIVIRQSHGVLVAGRA